MHPKRTSKDTFDRARGTGLIVLVDAYNKTHMLFADDIVGLVQDSQKRTLAIVDARREGNSATYIVSTNYDTILHAMITAREDGVAVDMRPACNLAPEDPLAADYLVAAPGSPTETALRARLRRVPSLKL